VNRTVTELGGPFSKAIALSDADLALLYELAEGALHPLTGPMTAHEWNRVLDEQVLIRNGTKHPWTNPIAFPITDDEAAAIKIGETVVLTHRGEPVGRLEVHEIYPWDKAKHINAVSGATIVMGDARTRLVGGEIWALPRPKNPELA